MMTTLEQVVKPVVLLVTTDRWYPTARLGMALASVGCTVDAVCPAAHPLGRTRAVRQTYSYDALSPLKSLLRAIENANPDLVIPGDDLATFHLYDLYKREKYLLSSNSRVPQLIEDSLGSAEAFRVMNSRISLMQLAQASGVRVPATHAVTNTSDLNHAISELGFPLVLKANGTSGGTGVRVVRTLQQASAAFEKLQGRPSFVRAIKRACVDHDLRALRAFLVREKPVISAQAFISGREATSTLACWKGTVLGSLHFEVVEKTALTGHATVVRNVSHPEMLFAAETIVRQLNLTGLHGLDFMVEADTAHAYLIELNPRSTQVGHLALGPERDLAAAIYACITGKEVQPRAKVTERETIALFPQEWRRDPESTFLQSGYHDVPWEEPFLVSDCIRKMRKLAIRRPVKTLSQKLQGDYSTLTTTRIEKPCSAEWIAEAK